MPDKDLKALFQHALQDVYAAETALLKALPRMAEAARSEPLRGALAVHLQETEEQIRRLAASPRPRAIVSAVPARRGLVPHDSKEWVAFTPSA
jgi:hypothetical protein